MEGRFLTGPRQEAKKDDRNHFGGRGVRVAAAGAAGLGRLRGTAALAVGAVPHLAVYRRPVRLLLLAALVAGGGCRGVAAGAVPLPDIGLPGGHPGRVVVVHRSSLGPFPRPGAADPAEAAVARRGAGWSGA